MITSTLHLCVSICKKTRSNIYNYEEGEERQKWPWIYFKYHDQFHSVCLICSVNCQSQSELLINHLHSHPIDKEKCKYYSWARKYYTEIDEFKAMCNICTSTCSLFISQSLHYHMQNQHAKKNKIRKKYATQLLP